VSIRVSLETKERKCPGKIRGLLCKACNMGLGVFKDNLTYLKGAIDYLSAQR
jgi:hypothetical protein